MITQAEPLADVRPAAPYNYPLEVLRGVAALLVALGHVLAAGPSLDPNYRPSGVWQYAPPGHLAVLVFFLLSGYVIGLANPAPLATAKARWSYLRKRFVRLYPLYVVALVGTGLLAVAQHNPFSIKEWGGYLVFLQGWVVEVPSYNQPLWSLPYEVGYYLAFVLVSARRWPAKWVAVGYVAVGLLSTSLHVHPLILGAVAYGGAFWFMGLALSGWDLRPAPPRYGAMLAWLLLLLAYQRLNPTYTALHMLGLDLDENVVPFFERPINFADLSYLLLGMPLLACFTNRTSPGLQWLERAAFAGPALYLLAYGFTGRLAGTAKLSVWLPAGAYVVTVIAYLLRGQWSAAATRVVRRLQPLGSISYGVYIIHYPLLWLVHLVPFFNGSFVTWLARLLGYFAMVLALSWLLERRLQPLLKRRLT
jgi:peptidoglycan/LPS O-acetylase OafA/YrhL